MEFETETESETEAEYETASEYDCNENSPLSTRVQAMTRPDRKKFLHTRMSVCLYILLGFADNTLLQSKSWMRSPDGSLHWIVLRNTLIHSNYAKRAPASGFLRQMHSRSGGRTGVNFCGCMAKVRYLIFRE